jgi:hypothetical protein
MRTCHCYADPPQRIHSLPRRPRSNGATPRRPPARRGALLSHPSMRGAQSPGSSRLGGGSFRVTVTHNLPLARRRVALQKCSSFSVVLERSGRRPRSPSTFPPWNCVRRRPDRVLRTHRLQPRPFGPNIQRMGMGSVRPLRCWASLWATAPEFFGALGGCFASV